MIKHIIFFITLHWPTSLIVIGLVPSLNWKRTIWVVNGATAAGLGTNANVNHIMGFNLDLMSAVKEMKIRIRTMVPVARFGKIMAAGRWTCDAAAPRRRLRCKGEKWPAADR